MLFNSNSCSTNFQSYCRIPTGISIKEAKAEMETYLVTVEIKIKITVESKCSIKFYKLFCDSYSLICFNLFLQENKFLFHLYFSNWIFDLCFLQTWLYIFWYSSILIVKPRIFNISIYSSFLNVFLFSWPCLLWRIERSKVFLKKYMIFQGFYLDSIKNILILFYHSFYIHLEKKNCIL